MIRISGIVKKVEKAKFGNVFQAEVESIEHEDDFGPSRYYVELPEEKVLEFQQRVTPGEVVNLPVVYRQSGKDGKHYLNWRLMKVFFSEPAKKKVVGAV